MHTSTRPFRSALGALAIVTLSAVASGCSGPGAATASPQTARATALTTIEADVPSGDATLHLWSRGGGAGGPVLVLINGGPGLSHESMDPLQEALASPTLRVVTYDQRGVGRSTAGGSAPFTPSDHLDDLDAIRRHFRQERVHLLGHSFGGMVALSYVDKYPDRVRSLILIGTGVSEPGVMQRSGARLGARIAQLQRQGLIPDPIPRGSCSETFTAVLPAYLADPKMAAPEPMLRRQCDRSGRSAILDAFIHTPYAGGVSTTTAPALVLYGEMDPFGPEPSAFAASVLSHAKVEVVELPRCGHLGWLECEGPFVARVRTFLQGQR